MQLRGAAMTQKAVTLGDVRQSIDQSASQAAEAGKAQLGVQRLQLGVQRSQLGVQRAQLGVQAAQLGVQTLQLDVQLDMLATQQQSLLAQVAAYEQLQGVSATLHQQLDFQRRQATLAQVLFETERAAASLRDASAQDPFATGVLATWRLAVTSAVRVEEFATIDAKRSWQSALDMLEPLAAAVRTDGQAQRFLRAVEASMRWAWALPGLVSELQMLGNTVHKLEAHLNRLDQGINGSVARRLRTLASGSAAGFCLMFVFPILAGYVGGTPAAVLGFLAVVAFFAWIVLGLAAFYAFHVRSERKNAEGRLGPARHRQAQLSAQLQEYAAFNADETEGAGLIERVIREHPLLAA